MLIVEKRWPKNKPVLEVQRLPNTVDLITISTTSKFTTSPFHILEIYFQDNFPLYRIIFVLVLSFSEFDNTHWMSHWKWFNNSLSGIHSQFLKKKFMQILPLMEVYIAGSITRRRLTIIWNLSLKLSSENFFIEISSIMTFFTESMHKKFEFR